MNKSKVINKYYYILPIILLSLIIAAGSAFAIFTDTRKSNLNNNQQDIDKEILNTAAVTDDWESGVAGAYSFTPTYTGIYNISLWGAQGGNGTSMYGNFTGGKGAYTTGSIYLTKGETIYIYVGGKPADGGTVAGGYNGGVYQNNGQYGAAGGGATDVRLLSGAWDDSKGLSSRIMVAAGGGGANTRNKGETNCFYGDGDGGAGGALNGIAGTSVYNRLNNNAAANPWYGYTETNGATQIRGGQQRAWNKDGTIGAWITQGGFGKNPYNGTTNTVQSGAGGGYYTGANGGHGAASGGSSFISGHSGCIAIMSETNTAASTRTNPSIHYSEKVFTNTTMSSGTEVMPNPAGGTMTGRTGSGYARITFSNQLPQGTKNGNETKTTTRPGTGIEYVVKNNAPLQSIVKEVTETKAKITVNF